jgi:NADH:ubiquinone oxidoreductase subunit 2 (subunit N)
MAGVPPFCGFFAKVFLFTLLANAHFFVLFPFFFLILFIGLYFYIQNIRFLNSRAGADFHPIIELNLRNSPLYYYLTFTILFFLIFGFIFTEDIILIMS